MSVHDIDLKAIITETVRDSRSHAVESLSRTELNNRS